MKKGLTKEEWILLAQAIIMGIGVIVAYLSYISAIGSQEYYDKTVDFYEQYLTKINETSDLKSLEFMLSRTRDDINRLKTFENISNETILELEIAYLRASNLATEAVSYKILGNETAYEEKIIESTRIIQDISQIISKEFKKASPLLVGFLAGGIILIVVVVVVIALLIIFLLYKKGIIVF